MYYIIFRCKYCIVGLVVYKLQTRNKYLYAIPVIGALNKEWC